MVPKPGDDIAARVRAFIGCGRAACRRMGVMSPARILGPDSLMVFMADAPTGQIDGGGAVSGRWVELDEIDGRWVADPIRKHDRAVLGEVDFADPAKNSARRAN
jgi:hypothetical protein